jgi:hypothetical protein
MRKGVSALVQQQALQKAWTSDAGIAGFRGMAEYDWDFNAAGYGRLRLTDNVGQLLRAVLMTPAKEAEPMADADSMQEPVAVRQSLPAARVVPDATPDLVPKTVTPETVATNLDKPSEPDAPIVRRHGSAKPG